MQLDRTQLDPETGLQYNRGAVPLAPDDRRWISQDPMGFDAGDKSIGTYLTCRPVAKNPTGLAPDGIPDDRLGHLPF